MNKQLHNILFSIEPYTGQFNDTIRFAMNGGDWDEVLSMLHRQSIDAPDEVKRLVGSVGFELILKVA
jgi:hypothetical protein